MSHPQLIAIITSVCLWRWSSLQAGFVVLAVAGVFCDIFLLKHLHRLLHHGR